MKSFIVALLLVASTVAWAGDVNTALTTLEKSNVSYIYSADRSVLLVITKSDADVAVLEQVKASLPTNVKVRVAPITVK